MFWSTIAHGGFRLPVGVAVNLKRAGLRAGTPDIMLVHDGRALFLELKADDGRLSAAQIDTHYAIMKAGGQVAVCKTLDEVRDWLTKWRVPTRVRSAA